MDAAGALAGLGDIANHWRALALGWHLWLAAIVANLALGWRPSTRVMAFLLAVPFVSVSALAASAGHPVNGIVFAVYAVALAGIGRALPATEPHRVRIASLPLAVVGIVLVAYGWVYPHFVHAIAWSTYLFAAPLGLLPSPTLSAAIGVTLLVDRLQSRAWAMALAAMGVVYGVIGVFWLGVSLDLVLIGGAIVLGASAKIRRPATFSAPGAAPET